MSGERNVFQGFDYWIKLFDVDKGRVVEVRVTDLSEEDFRRWLCWKLPRLTSIRGRVVPVVADVPVESEKEDKSNQKVN